MDLHSLTIPEVKKLFKEKKLSATELTKAYLDRIKKVEPKIKAFVTVTEERALTDARKADEMFAKGEDAPLLGIPFSIKDNCLTKGIRTTASSKMLDTFIPPFSATLVDRLVNAGIVLL